MAKYKDQAFWFATFISQNTVFKSQAVNKPLKIREDKERF